MTASAPDLMTLLTSAQEALKQVIATKPDPERLLAEMVRLCGGALAAGGAGTWVTQTPETAQLILEHNLAGLGLFANNAPIAGLNVAVRRAAREAKPVIVPPFFVEEPGASGGGVEVPSNPSPLELLFIPMKMHGKVAMVLMMATTPGRDAGMHRTQINFLQKMVGAVEQTLTERHLNLMEKGHGDTSTILKFAEQVHKHLFVREVGIDIANLVRDAVHADRATVELYPKTRKKIVAVSNVDEPSKRSAIFQAQRLILDYVRDRHVTVILDRAAAKQLVSDPALSDAAAAYFAASPFDAFLAAPIKEDDKVLGVVLTEYADSKKGQSHGAMLQDLCRVATSSVTNAIAYENIPLRRSLNAIGKFVKAPMTTKRAAAFTFFGLLFVGLVVICTIPMDFSIKANCQIRPTVHNIVDAPRDGKIVKVNVKAGDLVYADPNPRRIPYDQLDPATKAKVDAVVPLMELDTSALYIDRGKQSAELESIRSQMARLPSGAPDTPGKRAEMTAQMEAIQKQIAQIDREIADSKIYSPINGKVMTEDLDKKRETQVHFGDPLIEIINFKDWVMTVEIPESEIYTVRNALNKATNLQKEDNLKEDPGIEVEYILKPNPGTILTTRARGVATILPSGAASEGQNIFKMEIPVESPGLEMSGITGNAKVHLGKKPLGTQWFRGPLRLYRMTIGF
jgi:hypothetical protein